MESLSMIITLAIQLGIGKLIKSNPKLANGIIFWANWGAAIIINAGLKVALPTTANAETVSGIAHIVGNTIFNNPIVLGFIQSLLATGIHSTTKNTWEMIKDILATRNP